MTVGDALALAARLRSLHMYGDSEKGPGEREIMEEAENRALAMLDEMRLA